MHIDLRDLPVRQSCFKHVTFFFSMMMPICPQTQMMHRFSSTWEITSPPVPAHPGDHVTAEDPMPMGTPPYPWAASLGGAQRTAARCDGDISMRAVKGDVCMAIFKLLDMNEKTGWI